MSESSFDLSNLFVLFWRMINRYTHHRYFFKICDNFLWQISLIVWIAQQIIVKWISNAFGQQRKSRNKARSPGRSPMAFRLKKEAQTCHILYHESSTRAIFSI